MKTGEARIEPTFTAPNGEAVPVAGKYPATERVMDPTAYKAHKLRHTGLDGAPVIMGEGGGFLGRESTAVHAIPDNELAARLFETGSLMVP